MCSVHVQFLFSAAHSDVDVKGNYFNANMLFYSSVYQILKFFYNKENVYYKEINK